MVGEKDEKQFGKTSALKVTSTPLLLRRKEPTGKPRGSTEKPSETPLNFDFPPCILTERPTGQRLCTVHGGSGKGPVPRRSRGGSSCSSRRYHLGSSHWLFLGFKVLGLLEQNESFMFSSACDSSLSRPLVSGLLGSFLDSACRHTVLKFSFFFTTNLLFDPFAPRQFFDPFLFDVHTT